MIPHCKINHALVVTLLIFFSAMSTQALAQVDQRPGTKSPATASPSNNGGSRGGFGLSIDLGSLFKVVQSLTADDRYNSPDIANLPQQEPRQLIVSWPIDQQATAQAMLQASGGTPLVNQTLGNLGLGIAVIGFASDEQTALALPALQANRLIIASRHAIAYPMQSTDPVPGKQYAHDLLKAPAKDGIKLPSIITLGIIDTEVTNAAGLNLANFKAKRIFTDADKPAAPDHGNAVAAIMAGTGNGFEGLAQGTTMRAAGVMREVAPGINATNTLLVAQALDWMAGEKVQVVNLSLGSAGDAVLAAVVGKSLATGMLLVAAAGNGGPSAAPSYPAAYPGVIAVTAVDANKRLYARANRGNYIAIAAPGVDVWVPVSTGMNAGSGSKGKYVSGTSFAAPFVAAAVAQSLTNQANGQSLLKSPTQIQKLCSKAVNLGSATDEFGCGLLQM